MIQTLLEQPQKLTQFPFTLKPQQQQALDELRTFLTTTESFFLLCGEHLKYAMSINTV
jgi:hypothetical protein